ncbi:accessory factor associated with RNA polymerase II [Turnera subulata]|uniref:Accessory factor associated with RNA polymerase II n=1 Tax=Turnera subulata TaxID=218843 RepID=A0A9Q0IYR2_9ROSI|nr:accessory factor associated with RNA polymerase II [Turnera subulata]
MDPLSALRDYAIREELDKIVRVNGEFRFGNEYTFPCSVKTAYRSKQGSYYTLETLLFYIQNAKLKHTDYIQSALAHSIPTITFVDRKPLLDYLTGKLSSSDSIVFPLPQSQPLLNPNPPLAPSLDGNNFASAATAAPAAEDAAVGNGADVDYLALIRAGERPLKDRESLLQCRNRDFYGVLVASTRREEERQRMESQSRKDGLVAKSRLMGADERGMGYGGDELGYDSGMPKVKMHLKGGKIGEGVPIILVPSAFQTLITIYNVKEFLEDGIFVPTDVKAKQMKGPKPECVTVQKKFSTDRNRVMTAYEVRDKPSALKPDDWDRVVAVFVLGKEWQFKDWPFKDHVEIFNKIIGFFMRFEDDSVESAKTVKQWNVKIISISKNKRHQDRAAALEVWDRLEEFVRSRSHN